MTVLLALGWRYRNQINSSGACNESDEAVEVTPDPDSQTTEGVDRDSDNCESEAFHTVSTESSISVGSTSFASAACSDSTGISPEEILNWKISGSTDLCFAVPEILITPETPNASSSDLSLSSTFEAEMASSSSSTSIQRDMSSKLPNDTETRVDSDPVLSGSLSLSSLSSSASSSALPADPDFSGGMCISVGSFSLKVLEVLGRGSQTAVYKVIDGSTTFAAKLSLENTISLDLLHEFDILAGINHPNVIAVYQEIPRGFLMECLFQDLMSLIKSMQYLAPPIRDNIAIGILKGVNHIHMFGIAHLDIKPENILLTSCGVPKLADFRLAVRYLKNNGSRRHLESFRGTTQYFAPEIYSNEPIKNLSKSDCWSVGVTFYTMMSGQALFNGATEEEVYFNQLHERYSFLPHLSNLTPADKDYYNYLEMVKSLCRLDPEMRLTARQALYHSCFS